MATITSRTGARSWSVATDWVGDAKPADNDLVVIAADCQMLMDEDTSAFTGFQTVTISGHATTPGMLFFMDGTSGYLKIRTGYHLVGTSGAAKGRLLANSDGVWGNTGGLAFSNKAVIALGATSTINAQYLDIALYDTEPTLKSVRTYGTKYDFTASGATVSVANNTIDLGVAPPSAGTAVKITTAAGVLPTGLNETDTYYICGVSGNTCKLALQNSDATIVDITGTGSGTCTLFTGYASGSATVNVLDDVTSDTPWITTADHNRVVLVNEGPQAYDQQRLTLTTINAGSLVLSAVADSTQYPGARVFFVSRNVSIRSACTSGVNIVNYASASTSSGVFRCEINSTVGTGGTFYGVGLYLGTGHVASGTISGASSGLNGGTGHVVSGIIAGCGTGINSSNAVTVSGTIAGCANGILSTTGGEVSGVISGCTNGVSGGTGIAVSGTIVGCSFGCTNQVGFTVSGVIAGCANGLYIGRGNVVSGTISGCGYGINAETGNTVSGTIIGCNGGIYNGIGFIVSGTIRECSTPLTFTFSSASGLSFYMRGASVPSYSFVNRNTAGYSKPFRQGIFCENNDRVLGASYAYLVFGDVIKNTATVRSGGAASSMEVVPLSNCAVGNEIVIFEWTELNVPASAQNKSVYIRASEAFSVYPTAAQLYVEAEYISEGTTFATSVVTSTAVLSDGSTWVQFTIPEFTPAVAGHVRYRAFLGWYEAGKKIYVDNMLVAA